MAMLSVGLRPLMYLLSYDDHLHIFCFIIYGILRPHEEKLGYYFQSGTCLEIFETHVIDAVPVDDDPCRNETQELLAVLNALKQ